MPPDSLEQLFDAAIEQPAATRARWLEHNCADPMLRSRVAALLAADACEMNALDTPVDVLASRIDGGPEPSDPDLLLGTSVGSFALIERIGQGGMGVVYRAKRTGADFDQSVAVKLLRRGIFSALEQRLFRRERQALAVLNHPNIARLIDGGITESGVPYLAMEFVDGTPITTFCAQNRAGLEGRLRLMLTVCRAVESAHNALIVHRDIKPSNILVNIHGHATLLDFGIAKILDNNEDATSQSGLVPLTPEYAAPEQFDQRPITTATDVFSLGVLLHELLVGVRPGRDSPKRPSQSATDVDCARYGLPVSRSSLRKVLLGDLDNLILKAVDPEPARRYASARELADDLQQYLSGLPVSAHPPSVWYRTRKFVRRHRGGVVVTAALSLAVIGSLIVALMQAHAARQQAQRAEAVQEFLVGLFEANEPGLPLDRKPELGDLLRRGTQRVQTDIQLDPLVRIAMLSSLGHANRSLGMYDDALALFETADRLRAESGASPDERVVGRIDLAEIEQRRSNYLAALSHLDAIDRIALAGSGEWVRIRALVARADAELGLGRAGRALPSIEQALPIARRWFTVPHDRLASLLVVSSHVMYELRRFDEALSQASEALEIRRALFGERHADVSSVLSEIGTIQAEMGRCIAALEAHREAVSIDSVSYRDPHPRALHHMGSYAVVAGQCGELAVAAQTLEAVMTGYRSLLGPAHQSTLVAAMNVSGAWRELGRLDDSRRELEAAIGVAASGIEVHAELPMAMTASLASTELLAGNRERAYALFASAVERWFAVSHRDHRRLVAARLGWSESAVATDRFDVARSQLALASAFLDAHPEHKVLIGEAHRVRALLALRTGQLALAGASAGHAFSILESAKWPHYGIVRAGLLAAETALANDRPDQAAAFLARADAISEQYFPASHPYHEQAARLRARLVARKV